MGENHKGDVIVDIEMLYGGTSTPGDGGGFSRSTKACIFRTPCILSRHNKNAYLPNAFSFGPWHYRDERLGNTKDYKREYLRNFISRAEDQVDLKDLKGFVEALEGKARACYEGSVDLEKEEFCKVLLLDCCFVIELFYKFDEAYPDGEACGVVSDPLLSRSNIIKYLLHDLILLENQVPWLVLDCLFDKIQGPKSKGKSLVELALKFFKRMIPSETSPTDIKNVRHIVDLLRKCWVPSKDKKSQKELETREKRGPVNCLFQKTRDPGNRAPLTHASRLEEAGVRFKSKNGTTIDVKFERGVLEIPSLFIDETTEPMFRNIISFEQCYPNCEPRVTSFAKFLDNLMDTNADVETLCKRGVISNWLNPDDATKFFNRLYTDTHIQVYYHEKLCQELDQYCQRMWPRWRAFAVRNYLDQPWAVVSFGFATIISSATLLNATLAVLRTTSK